MQTENKLGVMPIKRLILHMSWPMMLSMFIQAMYNLVDSIFVAQISEDAFQALSLVYPLQTLMISICVGTGAGVSAVLSRRLGEGNPTKASRVALNGIFLYFLTWIPFLVFGLVGGRWFMGLYTDNTVIIDYGVTYLTIVTTCSLGMCMQFALERVMLATGNPMGHMIVQGVGAVTNLILDPIFIFTFDMGITGAAIATVLGQCVGMVVGFFIIRRITQIKLHFRSFRPDREAIADIYRIGLPAIVMQSLSTVMTMGLNKILSLFSDIDVVVLGIYFKLQSFIFMPVFGLNNGMVPVVSYNYGARNRTRIIQSIRFSLALTGGITLAGTLIILLCPQLLLSCFTQKTATIAVGVSALRIIAVCFIPAGLGIIFSSVFQALVQPRLSLIISLLRQIFLILPLAWFLCIIDHSLVWWCFPLTEGTSLLLCLAFYRKVHRQQLLSLPE